MWIASLFYISGLVFTICVLRCRCAGLLSKWSGDPDLVNYQTYYYASIRAKMTESLSASNCTIGGAALGKKFGDKTADLQVAVLRPRNALVWKNWGFLTVERSSDLRKSLPVYFQINAALCNSGMRPYCNYLFLKCSKSLLVW
jgi:hypothetical protein